MKHSNLLILAGGASSRMKTSLAVAGLSAEEIEAANTVSKALISFGKDKRPILDFLLKNAEKAGYQNVYLIIGEKANAFKKYYGNLREGNHFLNLNLRYVVQYIPTGRSKPLGTADAVLQAIQQYPILKNTSFTVCNCDNLYSIDALKAMRETPYPNAFIAYDREGLQFSMERIARFALVIMDNARNLIDIIEKPPEEKIEHYRNTDGSFRVSMNIFKFSGKDMFPYLSNCPIHPIRAEKELPTAILNFSKNHPENFKGIPFNEHVPDLTSKEDIKDFKSFLK